jgi:hypothetical protein
MVAPHTVVVSVFDRPHDALASRGAADGALLVFATELAGLALADVEIRWHRLANEHDLFFDTLPVRAALIDQGTAALPVVLVDGEVVARGGYPASGWLAGYVATCATSAPNRAVSGGVVCC